MFVPQSMGLSGRGVFQCENTYLGATSILQTDWTGNLAICHSSPAVSPVTTFQSDLSGLQAWNLTICQHTSYPRACLPGCHVIADPADQHSDPRPHTRAQHTSDADSYRHANHAEPNKSAYQLSHRRT